MKLLSLFFIVSVVAASMPWLDPECKNSPPPPRCLGHTPEPQIPEHLIDSLPFFRRFASLPSWYIDNDVKDAAGCSWSTVTAVQTLHTPGHRIYIDTARHGGTTGDSRNVCVYTPPHTMHPAKGRHSLKAKKVPGEWILATGTVGACGQGCCEWNPPENITFWENIPKKYQPTWYETTTDCKGEKPDLITGPHLMRGLEGQRKSICVAELCEKDEGCGTFWQGQGNLNFCTNHCCKLDDIRRIGPQPQMIID